MITSSKINFQRKTCLSNKFCQKTRIGRVGNIRCQNQQQQQQAQKSQEKFIDVDDVLSEIETMGGSDFVFEDSDVKEPVWEFEREPSKEPRSESSEVPFMLSPDKIPDILSAYDTESGFQEINVTDLNNKKSDFELILDVRHASDFKAGHIDGATNVPFDALSMSIRNGEFDDFKKGKVAVICGYGNTSSQATVKLSKVFGFENVVNVFGGMEQWITSKFEVVREQ